MFTVKPRNQKNKVGKRSENPEGIGPERPELLTAAAVCCVSGFRKKIEMVVRLVF